VAGGVQTDIRWELYIYITEGKAVLFPSDRFGLLELYRHQISRSQVSKVNFITMNLLVMERTKDTEGVISGLILWLGRTGYSPLNFL
jgi:hypothetical protein